MTAYARYTVLLPDRELERSRFVDDALVWPARDRVLEALVTPRNAEKWCDVAYYLDENGLHLPSSAGHVKCNWIGLAGIALYQHASVRRAIHAVWHDLDIPHNLVPDCYDTTFEHTAERLHTLFLRLDARLNVE